MAGMGRIRGGARGVTKWLALMLAVIAFGLPSSASATERTFLMGSFKDIIIIGDMQVDIVTGKTPSATAQGDIRMLDALRLDRIGTTMTLRLQSFPNNDKARPFTQPLIVRITNGEVRNVAVRGNAKLSISQIRQNLGAKMGIEGGGDIRVGNATADTLTADISGSGAVHISSGKIRNMVVYMKGSGVFDAGAMSTQQLKLTHEGNATSSFSVEDKADIFNTGSGSIDIRGKGFCFIRKAGAATIRCSHTGKE